MHRFHLRWYALLVPLIALIAGYATGHSPASTGNATVAVPSSSLTLEYPLDWRAARLPAALDALDTRRAVVLAPHGDASGGGLLAAAAAQAGSPLPAAVLARLSGGLRGEAISLVGSPAFRYQHVLLGGSDIGLTAYAIPNGDGRFTFAMCFSPRDASSTRAACERIVEAGEVFDEGGNPFPELKPDAGYASRLATALAMLAAVRQHARAAMAKASSASELVREAMRLADALAIANGSLKRLSTPPVAAGAAVELERAMLGAKVAYEELAKDAAEGERSKFAAARRDVGKAEAGISTALGSFMLLGYRVI